MAINSPPHRRHGSDCGLKADATTPTTDKEEESQNIEMMPMNSRSRPFYFRRCKKVATSIFSVPEDVLFTILSHLPAQYIYDQARVVCRKWYSMVRTQAFVNENLQHSRYGLLFSCKPPIFIVKPSAMGKVETYECRHEVRFNFSASCNGLILENHPRHCFYIVNPATRQRFILPSFFEEVGTVCCCGLAYAAASMKFKAVIAHAFTEPILWQCYILTVGVDESWRNVPINHLHVSVETNIFIKSPLITEGFMHWADYTHVLTLNVETEVFTEIPIPKISKIERKVPYFVSTGRCLCLVLSVAAAALLWEVWELKAETGEWRKMPDIDLRGQKGRLKRILGDDSCVLRPVGWLEYSELIFFSVARLHLPSRWISYNLHSHEIESIHDIPISHRAKVHKSSLLWIGES